MKLERGDFKRNAKGAKKKGKIGGGSKKVERGVGSKCVHGLGCIHRYGGALIALTKRFGLVAPVQRFHHCYPTLAVKRLCTQTFKVV